MTPASMATITTPAYAQQSQQGPPAALPHHSLCQLLRTVTFSPAIVRSLLAPRFDSLQQLGEGTFGAVYKAIDRTTGRDVAIKLVKRGSVTKYIEAEIVNHSLLRHPHIIQFKEVFLTPLHVAIVMENANGGTLLQLVKQQKRLPEQAARWFFQQLILALDYCHKKGVANRDIKLENLLLHQETHIQQPLLKMCDFGYSKSEMNSPAKSQVGTLYYMAPEIICKPTATYDAKAADVWSCGVVLYAMVFGKYPFQGGAGDAQLTEFEKLKQLIGRMQAKDYSIPADVPVSRECLQLIHSMLQPRVEQRITVDRIQQHPWFLRDLPSTALQMTDWYLALPTPENYQPAELVKQILAAARDTGIECSLLVP